MGYDSILLCLSSNVYTFILTFYFALPNPPCLRYSLTSPPWLYHLVSDAFCFTVFLKYLLHCYLEIWQHNRLLSPKFMFSFSFIFCKLALKYGLQPCNSKSVHPYNVMLFEIQRRLWLQILCYEASDARFHGK